MHPQNEFLNGGQKPQPAAGRDRNGFTVIDLLVVIGTIAMLSVLLLPAWAIESRSQTSNLRCANNLKQLGMCLTMYSDAYSDHYPAALNGSPISSDLCMDLADLTPAIYGPRNQHRDL